MLTLVVTKRRSLAVGGGRSIASAAGTALLATLALTAFLPQPVAAQTLSAAEVQAEMLGKTIRTRKFGLPITLHYRGDGTVSAKAPIGSVDGTWRARGNAVCTTFPSGPAKGTECVTFERTGPNSYRNSNGVAFTVR